MFLNWHSYWFRDVSMSQLINKLPNLFRLITNFIVLLSLSLLSNMAAAQDKALISRVAITIDQSHTNIWISDFPVKTKVILVDAEDNILGVVTTNQFGAAYTQLLKSVFTQVTARTLNGELQVTNTAIVKAPASSEPIAASESKADNKV